MDTKLTVRVPRKLLENAKRYASAHNTTLTKMVSAYLEQIPTDLEPLDNAPLVRQLTGLLSQEVSVEDYEKYLNEKYGRR